MVLLNLQGSGSFNPSGCLVTNVLDSFLDLGLKAHDCLYLGIVLERALLPAAVQGVVGSWIWFRVGGRSIRYV
ncbi:hypothetical protein A2U01_0005406 [Trifolium medium]|uniref:Uncharacterized protein n=1 Tax=Trifolium medium TaxID=97028 RepID=A0A392ME66_9FABA|nr:hypothetical protein [Trifolium medium]